jgi:nucleotide-binding universal stress UspA family protein
MHAFKHILIATDFNGAAQRALDAASELAAELHAKLTLLHVQSEPAPADDALLPSHKERAERRRHQLEATLEIAQRRCRRCEAMIRKGSPAEEIVTAAAELGAGLIVVGTHRRPALPEFVLGSVAAEVVRTSAIPVLVVPLQPPSGPGR